MAGEARAKAPPKFSGSGGDSSMRKFSASFSDGMLLPPSSPPQTVPHGCEISGSTPSLTTHATRDLDVHRHRGQSKLLLHRAACLHIPADKYVLPHMHGLWNLSQRRDLTRQTHLSSVPLSLTGKMKESSKKTWRNDMMKWKPSTSKAMVGFARQSQLTETNSRWFAFATITSFAGIFVAVYISETRYNMFKAGSEDPSWPYIEDLLKFLILLLTIASVFGILMYYHGMVLLFEIRGMYFAPQLPVWSRFHLAGL